MFCATTDKPAPTADRELTARSQSRHSRATTGSAGSATIDNQITAARQAGSRDALEVTHGAQHGRTLHEKEAAGVRGR
ncbi:hypothetical protein Axi01nite_95590 [Actinoplanes xinjiangensis]|nr:hypothetical protein Axi01nite_95590 [Actinoplanes xinjiangensis]